MPLHRRDRSSDTDGGQSINHGSEFVSWVMENLAAAPSIASISLTGATMVPLGIGPMHCACAETTDTATRTHKRALMSSRMMWNKPQPYPARGGPNSEKAHAPNVQDEPRLQLARSLRQQDP